ncbi:MAG: prepilin-type N-terminal cleavage/methylation domain-containing protein [Candidatus Zixiibacteriota bacterium]
MDNPLVRRDYRSLNNIGGFTLIELVIIIVVLGIVAAVAIPRMGSLSENSKINITREEMRLIKEAIIGNPQLVTGGQYIDRGFIGDVGYPPANLVDLVRKPDSIPAYDKFSRTGWNGPYLDSAENKYLYDAWDNAYSYDPAVRTITSTGADPDIVLSF